MISALRRHGPMTRTGIANIVDVSKPTIADVFAELLDDGLIRQIGHARGPRGPRAALFELNHRAAWVAGIDIGRRWLRVSVADLSGRIVARSDEPTDTRSHDALLRQVERLAHEVASRHDVAWDDIAHTTIGSPGVPDPASGAVALAPNLPGWDSAGLLASLRDMLGRQVDLDNDVNLAALAELWEGHGQGCDDFVYLWVGTGVGVGLILDGRLHRGAHGMAGEVAYLPLARDPIDEADAHRRGRFETATAGDALIHLAEQAGLDVESPESVFEQARQGEPRAMEVVEQEATTLALGLACVVPVVDPQLVVIGGGIGHNGEIMLEPLRAELARLSPFAPEIVTSALGTDAVLRGAVGSALDAAWDHVLTDGRPTTA